MPSTRPLTRLILITACSLISSLAYGGSKKKLPPVIDLTKKESIRIHHDWNLGPTGARGWMWGWNTETTNARQIYVTKVDKGSPADGVLNVGDVILGVGQKPFLKDARHALAEAITSAEGATGKLALTRWRNGQTELITIQLPKLGKYQTTSPFNCEKSSKILSSGCKHIAKRLERDLPEITKLSGMNRGGSITYSSVEITAAIDALALLASGDPVYVKLVEKYANAFAPENLEFEMGPTTRMASWGWGYINLFLCEYHLATGDKSVLPAIEKYTTSIAKGQSFIGSWGHTMAWRSLNGGKLHGSLSGYGALNSAGLACHLSLVLGQKCGVQNDEVSQAITKANKYIGFYTGKGAIPYGDHFPGATRHDDNGKNSMAAIVFDLQNMAEEARFFTAMSIASYGERESGHTGNYFSFLWGSLGAQRAGNDASAAFLKEQRWFYDLNRSWDGSFPYQGKANASNGEHSYRGWDCTGAFMLTYALPLKNLYITGKETKQANQLTESKLENVIAQGKGFNTWDGGMAYYQAQSSEALIAKLKSWSPAVRNRAALALAGKPDSDKFISVLIKMLDSELIHTRYGACEALGAMKERAKDAVPQLRKLLSSSDTWLRIQSATALTNIGKAAASAIPDLLKLATTLDRNDPLQITQRFLAFGLFDAKGSYGQPGLLSKSVREIDRDLLYKVVKQILRNPDGRTRGTVESVYRSLSYTELEPLFPAILEAVKTPSPSGIMFANDVRLSGLKLLAKYKIEEGMALCLQTLEINKWGKSRRITQCLDTLAQYEGAAKPLLPKLRQLKNDLESHREAKMLKPRVQQVTRLIELIEKSERVIKLRSITNK